MKTVLLILITFLLFIHVMGYSQTVQEHDKRAEKYYQEKQFSKALGEWMQALSIEPDNQKIQQKIELAYEEKHKKDIAKQKAKLYYKQAKKSINNNDFESGKTNADKAVDNYISAYRIDPFDDELIELKLRMKKLQEEAESKLKIHTMNAEKKKKYDAAFSTAMEYMKANDYENAVDEWNKVLKIAPEDVQAAEFKRKCELAIANRMKFEKLKFIIADAKDKFEKKEYQSSLDDFKQVIAIDPLNEEAAEYIVKINEIIEEKKTAEQRLMQAEQFYLSGKQNLENNEFDAARDDFENTLSLQVDYKDTKALIAGIENLEKQYLEKQKKQNLELINKEFQTGLIYMSQGNYSQALASFEKIIKLDPRNTDVKDLIKSAKEAIQQEREENIDEDSPYYSIFTSVAAIGIELYNKGEYNESLKEWKKITNLFPKNRMANQYIMKCYLKLEPQIFKDYAENEIKSIKQFIAVKNFKEAQKIIDTLKTIDSEYPELAKLQSLIVTEKEKPPVISDPAVSREQIDSRYNSALNLYQAGGLDNAKKALAELKWIRSKDPENTKTLISINKIESEIRLSEGTTQKQVKKLNPDQESLVRKHYFNGINYYSNNKLTEAIAEWKKVLSIDPDNEKAKSNIRKCLALMKQ